MFFDVFLLWDYVLLGVEWLQTSHGCYGLFANFAPLPAGALWYPSRKALAESDCGSPRKNEKSELSQCGAGFDKKRFPLPFSWFFYVYFLILVAVVVVVEAIVVGVSEFLRSSQISPSMSRCLLGPRAQSMGHFKKLPAKPSQKSCRSPNTKTKCNQKSRDPQIPGNPYVSIVHFICTCDSP